MAKDERNCGRHRNRVFTSATGIGAKSRETFSRKFKRRSEKLLFQGRVDDEQRQHQLDHEFASHLRQRSSSTQEENLFDKQAYDREEPRDVIHEVKSETSCYSQAPLEDFTRSYYECVSNGIVDMERITKYMHDLNLRGAFSQSSYEEFVSSVAATKARRFCYDGLRRMSIVSFGDLVYARTLDNFAAQIRADILTAQMSKRNRTVDVVERTRPPPTTPDISIRNCTQRWTLDSEYPFVKVDLLEVALHWHEKKGTTPFQKITDLYRRVLSVATSPPQEIQKYSMRINGRSGRNENLINLPQKIEDTLMGFGEDLLGLGHKELMIAPSASVWGSSFYMQLGQTEDERSKEYERLCEERIRWRPELFRALQRALRDLRGYEYTINEDGSNFCWIPNNRKSKRLGDTSSAAAKRAAVENCTEDSFELM